MTTFENFRRRQLIEGALLICVGIAMIFQGWYFSDNDREQRACVAEKFRELSIALDARAKLADRETTQNKQLWLIYADAAGLVRGQEQIKLTPKQQNEFNKKLVEQLLEYRKVINVIEKERKQNPLPPYPIGICTEE